MSTRPSEMKGQVENPQIRRLPITPIQKQPFQKRDALHSIPFFDTDQVSYLPVVQCLFLHLFIQSPEEIDGDPSQRILLPAVDSKQGKEISFEPFLLEGETIEGKKDEDPLRLSFSHFITINKEESFPVEVFPFEGPKKRPGEVPLLETCALLSGMGEEWPENSLAAEIFGFL